MQRRQYGDDDHRVNPLGSLLTTASSSSRNKKGQRRRNAVLMSFLLGLPLVASSVMFLSGIFLVPSHTAQDQANPVNVLHPKPISQSTDRKTQQSQGSKISAEAKPVEKENDTQKSIGTTDVEYHVVFSTGCSAFQDWQSFVFFYQALKSGQPGTITRIVSGCDDKTMPTVQRLFEEQIQPMAPDRFKIHFTPDYAHIKDGVNFPYFNKPFGMKHWLENALGYPDNPVNDDAIVVLLDPDQLIMRPFRDNDFSNTQWKFLNKKEPRIRIDHGKPMGQLYGFGLQWKDQVTMDHVSPNEPSYVDQMSRDEAHAGYCVGPPYIATARDMYRICTKWSEFAPRVHDQYPHLLAEMFAYSLAAAHLKLHHQTAASFMVSDSGAGKGEGWEYIDKIPEDDICGHDHKPDDLPNVLHFCQRYAWGPYFFGKRRLPKDFLTCESPLMLEPPKDFFGKYDYAQFPDGNRKNFDKKVAKEHAFMVCYLIPAVNAAAEYFKKHHCPEGKANLDKKLVFNKGMTEAEGLVVVK